jgi:hypothetical protein
VPTDPLPIAHDIVRLQPPWPQAFAIRSILRTLLLLFPEFETEKFFRDANPSLRMEIIRYVYLAAFRFEQAYRARVASDWRVDPRIEEAFHANRAMLGSELDRLGQWRKQFGIVWEVALLLAQDGTDQPFLAGRTIRSIHAEIERPVPGSQQLFKEALSADWEWCEPLDSQALNDMQQFFSEPLWASKTPFRLAERLDRWLAKDALSTSTADEANHEVVWIYKMHLLGQPIEWARLFRALLPGKSVALTSADRAAFLALVESPERIARLIARVTFEDRAHCELASAPSATGFKEALRSMGKEGAAELLAFEAEKVNGEGSFQPNDLWLAWVLNACRPGLNAIRDELRTWLPSETTAETVVPPPSESAPAARRATAKPPAKKTAARKPATKRASPSAPPKRGVAKRK